MIAELIKRKDRYICSNCRLNQPSKLLPHCFFCDAIFSNYEEITVEEFKEELTNEING